MVSNQTDTATSKYTVSRTALITGASRGLGYVLANFLAGQGFDLVLDARDAAALHESAERLRAYGGRVIDIPGDVSHAAHRRALAGAVAELGRLDLLVNNASTLGVTPLPTLDRYPLEQFEQVMEINLLAPLALVQAVLPLLEQSRGLVVNLSSDAAVGGYPGWGAYGASKAALDLVSKTMGQELKERQVSVVSVDPGDMRTQMQQDAFPGEDISDRPLPDTTLPFWAWLIAQDPAVVSGKRFQAQAEVWVV